MKWALRQILEGGADGKWESEWRPIIAKSLCASAKSLLASSEDVKLSHHLIMACAPIVSNETRSEVLTEVCGCLRQAPNPPTAAASNLDGRQLLALRSMGALLLHSPKSVDEVVLCGGVSKTALF